MQNALISQERGLSSIANRHPLGLAIPIVPSHTMFSMVETLGRHTKVHIIPSHCTGEGTDSQEMCQSVPFTMSCTYCPSHPIVPWEGLDGQGLYQSTPFAMPCMYCPSHPTVPWEGLDRWGLYQTVRFIIPLPPCTYCPSHPIVPWQGMDGRGLYQSVQFAISLPPCTYCLSHPIVTWEGMDRLRFASFLFITTNIHFIRAL